LGMIGFSFASAIDGKWNAKMQGPEGDMDLVFNFKVNGDTLTGTIVSPMGELPISNGKVKGDEFSFDVDAGGMTIIHQCKALGDSISMKLPGMPGNDGGTEIILKHPVETKK
jgi:hypothetical protein